MSGNPRIAADNARYRSTFQNPTYTSHRLCEGELSTTTRLLNATPFRLFMSEGDHRLDPSRSSSREIPGSRDGNQQRSHRDTDRHRIVRIDAVE